jgi:hypothetical protein
MMFCSYDTAYTERYLGQPHVMRNEYEYASLLNRVKPLLCSADARDDHDHDCADVKASGKRLLVIHGLLDDNVHARHALLLLQVDYGYMSLLLLLLLLLLMLLLSNLLLLPLPLMLMLQQLSRMKQEHVSEVWFQVRHVHVSQHYFHVVHSLLLPDEGHSVTNRSNQVQHACFATSRYHHDHHLHHHRHHHHNHHHSHHHRHHNNHHHRRNHNHNHSPPPSSQRLVERTSVDFLLQRIE